MRTTIGERAAHLILDRIERGPASSPQCILVPAQLIVRESCGARLAGFVVPDVSA
jgi:DNA-binding LacI/PurR family transcriptional regulator